MTHAELRAHFRATPRRGMRMPAYHKRASVPGRTGLEPQVARTLELRERIASAEVLDRLDQAEQAAEERRFGLAYQEECRRRLEAVHQAKLRAYPRALSVAELDAVAEPVPCARTRARVAPAAAAIALPGDTLVVPDGHD